MSKLKFFSKEIIPIYTTATGEKVVVGRELHEKLGIGAKYEDWFPRMCAYGFTEEKEYCSFLRVRSDGKPGRRKREHILTLDMAKHITMIQRTEIGKEIRQKLIDLEKQVSLLTGEDLIAMAVIEAKKILSRITRQSKKLIFRLVCLADGINEMVKRLRTGVLILLRCPLNRYPEIKKAHFCNVCSSELFLILTFIL